MRKRQIMDSLDGSTEDVSLLALGCSHVGSFGNLAPDWQVRETLALALDLGITLFDTADIYGQGDSERALGRLLRGRPDAAFVLTKAGNIFSAKMRLMRPLKPLLKPLLRRRSVTAERAGNISKDFSARHLRAAVEGSLRRLGTERLDALLLHSPGVDVVRDPAVADCLADLKRIGRLRHYGVSVDDLEVLAAASEMPGVSIVQAPLPVLDAAAGKLAAHLRERRIAVLAREVIRGRPGLSAAQAVRQAADRDDITSVIAGTTNPAHLRALVQALDT